MPRETKKFTTPNGVEVEVKTYLTGFEMRAFQEVFLKGVEVSSGGEAPEFKNMRADVLVAAQDKLIELVVVSVNKSTEDCRKAILDLPSSESNFILDELNKLSGEWFGKKKS